MVTTEPVNGPTALAGVFATLSKDLLGAPDEPAMFDLVVQRAVDIVPACDHAGTTIRRRRGRFETVAVTDPLIRKCDMLQLEMGQGPFVDVVFETEDRLVDDLRNEQRWPEWAEAISELGLRSLLAVRLRSGDDTIGALTFYSTQLAGFRDESHEIATIFAAHAAEALSKVKQVNGLQAALETRHKIGIAQGVLSQRYDITYERAFEVMRRYSNDTNTKLRDIAESVLEKRALGDFEALVSTD